MDKSVVNSSVNSTINKQNIQYDGIEFRNTTLSKSGFMLCLSVFTGEKLTTDKNENQIVPFDNNRSICHKLPYFLIIYKSKDIRDNDLKYFEEIESQSDEIQSTRICGNFDFEDNYCIIIGRRARNADETDPFPASLQNDYLYNGLIINPGLYFKDSVDGLRNITKKQLIEDLLS